MNKALKIFLILAITTISGLQLHATSPADDFHFFKNIVISRSTLSNSENSIRENLIFTKDNDYNITLANKDCEMKLEIRDEKGKIVATNYDEETKTYYNAIIFQCHATQFYSLHISPKVSNAHGICRIVARHH
jgi:hypothetical protein